MSLAQFDERVPVDSIVTIAPGDGVAWKTLRTAGSTGGRVDDVLLSNTDAAAHAVVLGINAAGTHYTVCNVNVPAGSGVAGVAPVQVFATQLPTQQAGILLAPSAVLDVRVEVAVGAATSVTVVAFGGDF